MSTELLRPPAHLSPPESLHLSQQAPEILRTPWSFPWPLSLLLVSDSPEKWTIYENLFYSCVRTGDNRSAALCLQQLKDRFGDTNERVMGLMGVYHEATAPSEAALVNYVEQYSEAIDDAPTNIVVRKRRIALLESLGRFKEAAEDLVELLEISPIDAEAWAELADIYFAQGQYKQAIFSLEEVLLVMPNAWNMHARLAEVIYISAVSAGADSATALQALTRSMKTFCRSIELCNDYLRGYYGLKLSTSKLIQALSKPNATAVATKEAADADFQVPPLSTVQKLNELATSKLAEIIRKFSTGETGWTGYEESEVIAARALLDRDNQTGPR